VPELPEVETVRRMLEENVLGRTIRRVGRSRHRLRAPAPAARAMPLHGRMIEALRRHGKFLLIDLSGGLSVISHLGMSGRWLFYASDTIPPLAHVHVRIAFENGTCLWYQDPRRFGTFRSVPTAELARDPSLRNLGPDPLDRPPTGAWLVEQAHALRLSAKSFLLDQRRVPGIGNIYASEILHRAGVHPGRPAGTLRLVEWERIAAETRAVLGEAIEMMGTTFSTYRTLWNEPGAYGAQLLVYDRAGEPCLRCASPVRRIVQGQRSTFYCSTCQPRRPGRARRSEGRSSGHSARERGPFR